MVRPSQRVEAARKTVTNGIMNVRQACEAFKISYCCYHYKRKLSDDNIAVRVRGNKKVQNLNEMWYKEVAKHLATQGDFGLESP